MPELSSTTAEEATPEHVSAAAGPSSAPAPASPSSSSSSSLRRRLRTISSSDHLYLRLPSGLIKYVKPRSLDPNSAAAANGPHSRKHKVALKALRGSNVASLGKFGSFDLEDLEGVPYGWTWEIGPPKESNESETDSKGDEGTAASTPEASTSADATAPPAGNAKKGKQRSNPKQQRDGATPKGGEQPGSLRVMLNSTLSELQETNATNEDIYDDPSRPSDPEAGSRHLTMLDIQALKSSGLEGQALIDNLTKASSSFEKRTVFSQDKFVRRKEAKHLRLFTPIPPTLATLVEYNFGTLASGGATGQPDKVRGMRLDTVSQMLSAANVGAGGRYLVVDGTSGGLLIAACLERMGGRGRLIAVHDYEVAPEWEMVKAMNLPPSSYAPEVLTGVNWAQLDPSGDGEDEEFPEVPEHLSLSEYPKSSPENVKLHRLRDRERSKALKKYAAVSALRSLRDEILQRPGSFDGLLVSSPHDAYSVLSTLLPLLKGSGSFVLHSPYMQPLVETHAALRGREDVVNVGLSEPWIRRWQVLPGRTHPEMMTSSTGGYLLSGARVWTKEEVKELMEARRAQIATTPAGERAGEGEKRGEKRTADVDGLEQAAEEVKKVKSEEATEPAAMGTTDDATMQAGP